VRKPATDKWTAKPPNKGSGDSETAVSSEVATKSMSIGYLSGPLCYMPNCITSNAQAVTGSLPQSNGKTNPI